MTHRYIKQILLLAFRCAFLSITFLPCAGQKMKVTGRYQKLKGNELIILKDNNTFICLRNHIQKSDVIIPLCDTLATGLWNERKGFITLKNRKNFEKVDYSVVEAETGSKDSLYFKMILPVEDALNYKNFKFSVVTTPLYGQINESNKPEFAIKNKMHGYVIFGLAVQNLAPNCDVGEKCYQRIYFNVFEHYRSQNSNTNYFTVTLKNFNQCFYESMDVDGEIIGVEDDNLFWRGNIYKKVN